MNELNRLGARSRFICSLVQHDQTSSKIGETAVGDGNRYEENDTGCGQIEQDKRQDELPKLRNVWN